MLENLKRLRRAATVVVAAAAVTAMSGIPTAQAGIDDYCGYNEPMDGVFARGCWYPYPSQPGAWVPSAKLRIPSPLDPSKWSYCELRLATFKKSAGSSTWVRVHTSYGNCLPDFVAHSQDGRPMRLGDTSASKLVFPDRNTCYYVLARWFGTYNGQAVGMTNPSGPFATSWNLCGDNATVAPISGVEFPEPSALDTPTVVTLPSIDDGDPN